MRSSHQRQVMATWRPYVIAACIFGAVAASTFALKHDDLRHDLAIATNGQTTAGTITSVWSSRKINSEKGMRHRAEFTYTVDGQMYTDVDRIRKSSGFEQGQSVSVLYDPANPAYAHINDGDLSERIERETVLFHALFTGPTILLFIDIILAFVLRPTIKQTLTQTRSR